MKTALELELGSAVTPPYDPEAVMHALSSEAALPSIHASLRRPEAEARGASRAGARGLRGAEQLRPPSPPAGLSGELVSEQMHIGGIKHDGSGTIIVAMYLVRCNFPAKCQECDEHGAPIPVTIFIKPIYERAPAVGVVVTS